MTVAKCRAVLVEKVARALFETPPKGLERWELWRDADHLVREEYREYARAALTVALEEAANAVAALPVPLGNTYSYGMYWEDGVDAAEGAIRALIEGDET